MSLSFLFGGGMRRVGNRRALRGIVRCPWVGCGNAGGRGRPPLRSCTLSVGWWWNAAIHESPVG